MNFKSVQEYNAWIKAGKPKKWNGEMDAITVKPNEEAPSQPEATTVADVPETLDGCETKEQVVAFAESKGLDITFGNRGVAKMKELVQAELDKGAE